MSASQLFPNQPAASSSNLGGSRPRIIFKFPQAVQPVSAIPLSNALPSVPSVAKKITPSSLPSNVQSIYDNAYLANLSPEILEQSSPRMPFERQVIPAPSYKGKEVVHDPVDVNVKMEAPDAMDSMDLDYPEDVPPASAPIPAVPAPALTKPAVIWKVNNRQSCHEVSGLKTWFFEPLVKLVPSDGSIPSQDEIIQTAIECIIIQVAKLLSGSSRTMIEQDLWALADGLVQGVFNDLKKQLNHPSSEPPAPFLNCRLTQFIESLSMINLSSSDSLETENLHVKEQVSSQDSQLKEKDEELTRLKSFVRHFKGDIQSTEVQQLRGAMEAQDSEIEELKKKLAASEEAH
ncbi:hypothetical protein GYMLUDRAFT_251742 [Collybiopsis luxurians FD-317 M1]|uniref:Unplaced genomic scaffold GYMLUscaffold_106, whole genome shotgun sequence n=1 Tax=Collybiopsis luxurians FD-317 M1 TaxID=944289 RepID=A0A0D0BQB9_9AGAR|nr:hypothetical protein GYMLUDRAFT_251742 [Collybiopsis luxurians FD-317 M1]